MDEFKSKNELRLNSNERFKKKNSSVPKVPVSKQHLVIGIGILLLLISLGLTFKSPLPTNSVEPTIKNVGNRNIVLPGSYSNSVGDNHDTSILKEMSIPSIGGAPPNSTLVIVPNNPQQMEITNNTTNMLSQKEKQANGGTVYMNGQDSSSTLAVPLVTERDTQHQLSLSTPKKLSPKTRHESKQTTPIVLNLDPQNTSEISTNSIQSAPANYYTLQLSSASQPTTLNAYVCKQKLSQYWIYETRRNGTPWYVLVKGVYPSLSQAKNAITRLPINVQAQKPWVRKIGEVKQDKIKIIPESNLKVP